MEKALMEKALMEFTGTCLLLFTIQVSVGTGRESAPIAIGFFLVVIVYAGGPISGAHYNPAVSLAIMLRGKQSRSEMIIYWISQIVGGILGAFLGGCVAGVFYSF